MMQIGDTVKSVILCAICFDFLKQVVFLSPLVLLLISFSVFIFILSLTVIECQSTFHSYTF
jgi:hypothetical protein